MPRYFHITPFGYKKTRDGKEIDFDFVKAELVAKAATEAGLEGGTTAVVLEPGSIHEDMFQLILESDTVICDVTIHSANVWYELGIRHAMRKKNTILIKGTPSDDTPFDVLTYRYVKYDAADPGAARPDLVRAIKEAIVSERESDSPVFKMLPKLEEPDPERIQAVPRDFAEEVERAKAGGSVGWLRLLGEEVRGLRFERPGLRLVGAAQLDIKDYEGAERTWTRVQEPIPDDIEANLALANVLERRHRRTLDPVTLLESDQAVLRALANAKLSDRQRAEGLAFHGRNAKTRWRLRFKEEPELEERRRIATSQSLIDTYTAYRDAFLIDLNHFWSGLAALQMNAIGRNLAQEHHWNDRLKQPDRLRQDLERDYDELVVVVARGIENALERVRRGEPKDGDDWADISQADLMFIKGARVALLANLYSDAIDNDGFKRDAAVGQLKLFQSLGVRGEDAERIIAEIRRRFPSRPETEPTRCVVVVAGHQIDEPDRPEARFPAAAEASAREKLLEALGQLKQTHEQISVFASAASGTDILCHEACDDLGIASTICLPIPPNDFAAKCHHGAGEWRNRFVRLTNRARERTLVLSRSNGLPNWLRSKEEDPWRRGNCWVVEIAGAMPADRRVLVALWDGRRHDESGGTAHVVELAEARGFELLEIPTTALARG